MSKKKKKIILEVLDRDDVIERLLVYIMKLSNIGHSFDVDVDVDVDDKQHHKHFYIDGDGSDRIVSFKVEDWYL